MPENLMIVILIAIVVLITVCIVFLIRKDKKNEDTEIKEILHDLANAKPREIPEQNELINAKMEVPIGEKKEIKIVEDEKLDLDAVLNKMQQTLDSQQEIVNNFEEEQEEKSIISYQELLDNMKKEGFKQDIEKHEEEQELSFEDITKEKVKEFLMKEEKNNEIEERDELEDTKFKTTEFISPIFGTMEPTVEYNTIKKAPTFNFKHAKKDKNTEFLESLIEFRNNL